MQLSVLQPHQYPHRVLLLVSGMSPQVVTETLYALSQGEPAFVPTEVRLLTTSVGAEQARLNLLEGQAHFHRFCEDYGLDPAIFPAEHVHVIRGRDGQALADIRSPEDNEVTADCITEWVRRLTDTPDSALHVSMAGGRKTMGYYAGYALSLFGRSQDRLSHVLISEGYESLPDFYYPTPYPRIIHDRNQRALDASRARVQLANIPFVRLRQGLPQQLLDGKQGFSESIRLSQRAQGTPRLVIDLERQQLECKGVRVDLPPARFAFYCWVAQRTEPLSRAEIAEAVLHVDLAREFLDFYKQLVGEFHVQDRVIEALEPGMDVRYLESTLADIKRTLTRQLGPVLAAPYLIHNLNSGQRGGASYALALTEDQITWQTP